MARNGIILESYARSAGTGNQPVPGTVTSRRGSSRHERQAALKRRQEEEDKLKKQKEAQEQIAKILAHKWAEEDRKKGSRRRREEQRPRDDSSDEAESRQRSSKEARTASSADADGGAQDPGEEEDEVGERVAGWVSYERAKEPKEKARGEKSHRATASLREEKEKEVLQQLEATRSKGSASSSSSSSQARRFTEVTGEGVAVAAAAKALSIAPREGAASRSEGVFVKGVADARKPDGKPDAGKAHSRKVANVFGFGMEEDDDEESSRRELELAARSKKAKLSLHADVQAGGQSGGFGSEGQPLSTGAAAAVRRPMDMCTQLMKMAQWKRSCGGKRLPMPKDLEANVAKAMHGGQHS